jgi:hypothetical protein
MRPCCSSVSLAGVMKAGQFRWLGGACVGPTYMHCHHVSRHAGVPTHPQEPMSMATMQVYACPWQQCRSMHVHGNNAGLCMSMATMQVYACLPMCMPVSAPAPACESCPVPAAPLQGSTRGPSASRGCRGVCVCGGDVGGGHRHTHVNSPV